MLEKISQDYFQLKWDVVATRYLAEAQLKNGKPEEARKVVNSQRAAIAEANAVGDLDGLITRTYDIGEAPNAFADLEAGRNARGLIRFD